jgi:hypothetical protein
MKIKILTLLFILPCNFCFSQTKNEKKNTVSVSVPLLLNNSNGVFYSLGNRRAPKGKAISYGINFNYTRKMYKNWFASVGVGYFKQLFNIRRPFDFDGDTITNLLYSTKKYNYHCLALNTGLGYSYTLNNKFKLNGIATFNSLSSFRQVYNPNGQSPLISSPNQVNKKYFTIGYNINISPGVEYLLSQKISVGADIVLPIITKWENDDIFIESAFGDDSRKIAENKFSIGTTLSCKYHF